jgi:hypothetical protein
VIETKDTTIYSEQQIAIKFEPQVAPIQGSIIKSTQEEDSNKLIREKLLRNFCIDIYPRMDKLLASDTATLKDYINQNRKTESIEFAVTLFGNQIDNVSSNEKRKRCIIASLFYELLK